MTMIQKLKDNKMKMKMKLFWQSNLK
nr:unnamed protein product [Callosobruchus analis]